MGNEWIKKKFFVLFLVYWGGTTEMGVLGLGDYNRGGTSEKYWMGENKRA